MSRSIKVMTVLGTRPEAIKLGPVIQELRRRSQDGSVQPVVCVTGQHRQMLGQVMHLFDIRPDYDLAVMVDNQTPSQVASAVLARLDPVIETEKPDWVLVQGDTTTVAAAALTAFYQHTKVGHVEAGLRTNDKWQPFPEEVNRRVASVIADLHFAPTECARQNLRREGVPSERIVVTGNPVIDALRWVTAQPYDNHVLSYGASAIELTDKRLILVTAHRRENFGQPLENICLALRDIAVRYDGKVCIVYPVHLNPNIWEPVHRILADTPGIVLLPPLEYLPLVHLMKHAHLIITDSGGIQEEAPGLGKPVLVLREVTERPEAVEAGTARLLGTDRDRIVSGITHLLEDHEAYQQMARAVNPYGDGSAARRIVATLLGEPVQPWQPGLSGIETEAYASVGQPAVSNTPRI